VLTGVWLLVLLSSAEDAQPEARRQTQPAGWRPTSGRDVTRRQPGAAALAFVGVRRRLSSGAAARSGWAALTNSELAVVGLVVQGLINREMAAWLFASPHTVRTVRTHLRHVLEKLKLDSRVAVASVAARQGSPAL
jgi:DNA-binding CsgD family transcriptional regulator